MNKNPKEKVEDYSLSAQVAIKTLFETFKILKENKGQLEGKEVIDLIPSRIELSKWEKERYEKTGYIRWQSILHFFTIDAQKAGFIRKNKGMWFLTKEGEEAMKLGSIGMFNAARSAYKKWREDNPKNREIETEIDEDLENSEQLQKVEIEKLETQAMDGLKEYLKNINPYEFQDIVAALLRSMGYYTPFIAPRGKDGGVDIVAYKDPLGTETPVIKVQVKHRPDAAIPITDIRNLSGVLSNGEVGLFVTSGRFTSESENGARVTPQRIELIDFDRLISLWQENYNKLSDEEKNIFPLHKIFFLGTNE